MKIQKEITERLERNKLSKKNTQKNPGTKEYLFPN